MFSYERIWDESRNHVWVTDDGRLRAIEEASHHFQSLIVDRLHHVLKAHRAHLSLQLVDLLM